jgi:uncharacterized protein YprB with RNaseH-like and TPR domain
MQLKTQKNPNKPLLSAEHYHCKHGHNGLSHPQCWEDFVSTTATDLRVGYLDIEATNLDADFGIMLSYSIKVQNEDKIYSNVIQQKDINALRLDKPLVAQLLKDMENFDMLVTYYGTGYDIPFIRTRALKWNLPFPEYGAIIHHDLYYVAKSKLKLSRNRLENVGRLLGYGDLKTHLDPDIWTQALLSPKARNYILDHNQRDVILLEKAHKRLIPYTKGLRRSI